MTRAAIVAPGAGASETDAELIAACRRGRQDAWERLLRRYTSLVFSIPLRCGLSREDAADITQVTFTVLLQSLDTLHPEGRLASWLGTVARRHAWRLLEGRQRERLFGAREDRPPADATGEPGPDEVGRWELEVSLKQGLDELGGPCRELLLALYFDPHEPSYAQVARRLGRPLGSIGPTRARCLERLRRVLGDLGDLGDLRGRER